MKIKTPTGLIFCSLVLILFLYSCNSPENRPPNIILIMADDLGYNDVGCYGSTHIKTPVIDRLAAEGLLFTDYHANGAVCTPTRAALMTGNYQQKSGLEGVIYVQGETRSTGLDPSELTIAEVFRDAGYATGIMGKWHLGYHPEYNPVNHGFDQFYGYVSGNVDYHSHYDNAGIYDWWHNSDSLYEEGYTTDLITEHSINFMRDHVDQAFFLYLPHEAPHVPFQARTDSAYRFPDREFTYLGPVEDQDRAYREMVEHMDEGIGQIMQSLKDLELNEHTLVFFCSDNGARFGSNRPLRGAKGSLWEGGHRVPAIAWYPAHIKAGRTTDATVLSMDLVPTLLALAGIEHSYDFDGMDLSSHLLDEQALEERPVFWRYRESIAVRQAEWKFLKTGTEEYLFNLREDLSEQHNLIQEHPDIAEKLKSLLDEWENELENYPQKTI